jgi:DNA-binding beta-propeller fold protein YncE
MAIVQPKRAAAPALATGFLASLLLLACLASSADASDRVYWANDGLSSDARIAYAHLDGSGGGHLDTGGAPSGSPRGVAIDVGSGRAYWTNRLQNQIAHASLDGGGSSSPLTTWPATVNLPNAAAVYPAAGRIYWANEGAGKISFAGLDNAGGGDLVTGGATVDVPIAPVVDPESERIYWGNGGSVNKISWANLDGTGGGDLNTTGATVNNPHGLALDPLTNTIYWANIGPSPHEVNVISYARLDNSGGDDLVITGVPVEVPIGLAIDPAARKIYWANWGGNRISVANLDGSEARDLNTTGATLSGSRSPVLLKVPSGTGAPQITGGSATGSVLTCSRGSWAPDLLGSWLYRAPRTLAYSWSRDGADIAGENGSTYGPTAEGDYRCRVTASNPAGSSSQTSAAHAIAPAPGGPPAGGSSQTSAAHAIARPARAPSQPSAGRAVSAPAFGANTRVSISIAARRIPGRGPIRVMVGNRNNFRVSGVLSAQTARSVSVSRLRRLAIRGKVFVVRAGSRKSVTLKLSKTLARVLKREGKLSLRLSAKVKDPAGNTRSLRKNVSLRLKSG